jgi:hypothetical protein
MATRIVHHTPVIDVASAAQIVPDLTKLVQGLRGRTEAAVQIRLEALAAALGPILEPVAHSGERSEIDAPVKQACALLEMMEDTLSGPSDESVLRSIAAIQALLGVPAEQRAFDDTDESVPGADDSISIDDASLAAARVETMLGLLSQELCNRKTNDAGLAVDRIFVCLHAIGNDFDEVLSFIRAEEQRTVERRAAAFEVSHA